VKNGPLEENEYRNNIRVVAKGRERGPASEIEALSKLRVRMSKMTDGH